MENTIKVEVHVENGMVTVHTDYPNVLYKVIDKDKQNLDINIYRPDYVGELSF